MFSINKVFFELFNKGKKKKLICSITSLYIAHFLNLIVAYKIKEILIRNLPEMERKCIM
jgi:hypothetical protein